MAFQGLENGIPRSLANGKPDGHAPSKNEKIGQSSFGLVFHRITTKVRNLLRTIYSFFCPFIRRRCLSGSSDRSTGNSVRQPLL